MIQRKPLVLEAPAADYSDHELPPTPTLKPVHYRPARRCASCRGVLAVLLGGALGALLTLRVVQPGVSGGGWDAAGGESWTPAHLLPGAVAPAARPPQRPSVVLFGDSLTAKAFDGEGGGSWGGGLQNWYGGKADVVARGLPGYNTRWAAARLAAVFPSDAPPPRLVVLWLGANDAAVRRLNPAQHVGLQEYKANLRAIIDHLLALSEDTNVLVLTPPPVAEERLGATLRGGAKLCGSAVGLVAPADAEGGSAAGVLACARYAANPTGLLDRRLAQTKLYSTAAIAVANEAGVAHLDTWRPLEPQSMLSDGFHLNAAGNAALLEAVQTRIRRSYPSVKPSALPPDPLADRWDTHVPGSESPAAAEAEAQAAAAEEGGAAQHFEALALGPLGVEAMAELGCEDQAALVTAALSPTDPSLLLKARLAANAATEAAGAAAVHAVVGAEAQADAEAVNLGVAFVLLLLLLALVLGYVLHMRHIKMLHEAGGALLVGIAGGALLHWAGIAGSGTLRQLAVRGVARFDERFFFFVLLPPVILEAGYNMQRRKFFQNMGAICMLAFCGTLISTAVIGGVIWGSGLPATSLGDGFTLQEALIFGSLISATDPVTVLAIFGSQRADRDLNALVFGESVLNDAVAIVLYQTLDSFNPRRCAEQELAGAKDAACVLSTTTLAQAFGSALRILFGSLAVGVLMGFGSAYLLKRLDLRRQPDVFFATEMLVVVLCPYIAWMLAEAASLSGIVATLFCGIVMAHYTAHNLHPDTLSFSRKFFKVVAFGCESFVFVYMGLALFSFRQDAAFVHWKLYAVAALAMLLGRACNVFPVTALVNCRRRAERRISMGFQKIVWFAGLRGAVAFALALKARVDYDARDVAGTPGAGRAIFTMTLVMVLLTVLGMGGSIFALLGRYDAFESKATLAEDELMHEGRRGSSLLRIDRTYIKPLFLREWESPAARRSHSEVMQPMRLSP